MLSLALIILLTGCVVGYFVSNDFRGGAGGWRMTGGINANSLGLIGYISFTWALISRLWAYAWNKYNSVVLLLSLIVIIGSFSRAVVLATAIMLLVLVVFGLLRVALQFKITRAGKKFLALGLVSGLFLYACILLGVLDFGAWRGTQILKYAIDRYTPSFDGDANLLGRLAVWRDLLAFFYQNPLTGGLGWFNATNVAAGVAGEAATSPHNLYVRLLSETGLIGLFAVMVFPLLVVVMGTVVSTRADNPSPTSAGRRENSGNRAAVSVATAAILGIFLGREMFEDSYLTSFVAYTTFFICFLSSVVFSAKRAS